MIRVTKFDGTPMMLNADWIQSIENTPDTLITLTNGVRFIIRDAAEDVVKAFLNYKHELMRKVPESTVQPNTLAPGTQPLRSHHDQ